MSHSLVRLEHYSLGRCSSSQKDTALWALQVIHIPHIQRKACSRKIGSKTHHTLKCTHIQERPYRYNTSAVCSDAIWFYHDCVKKDFAWHCAHRDNAFLLHATRGVVQVCKLHSHLVVDWEEKLLALPQLGLQLLALWGTQLWGSCWRQWTRTEREV